MKKSNLIFLFFTILALILLGSVSHPLSQEVKTEQQNGVTIISNPKTPQPVNGIPIRLVFKEELSIGVEEGDEEYMFGTRVYFNTDDEGYFFVNDWDRKFIKKFDPAGKFLTKIGRPGQGPGEFQNVWMPRFDKDNNLYVSDIVGSRRITHFDKGTFLKQIRVPIRLSNIYINSLGFYIGYQSTVIEDPKKGDSVISVLGLFDTQFHLLSEINRDVHNFSSPTGRGAISRAEYLANILSEDAFKPTSNFLVAENDFIYFGFPELYEIEVYSPDGKLSRIIQRSYDPIKINKKHKDDYIRYQDDEFLRFLRAPDQEIKKDIIKLVKYPKHLPPYMNFTLMENGWLAVVVDAIEGDYTIFDLFDEEGRYIAHFKASIPMANLFFKNGKAYALAIVNDYRYVKRYNFEIQEKRNDK